jgi:hypothetical protein
MRSAALLAAVLLISASDQSFARGHSYSYHRHSSSHYYTNVSGHRVHRPVFSGTRLSPILGFTRGTLVVYQVGDCTLGGLGPSN